MAGRGGRPTTSLTQEQLVSLGVVGKELPTSITAPPPIFPTLLSKPILLEVSVFFIYILSIIDS